MAITYDIQTDVWREVTQAEVDDLLDQKKRYHNLRIKLLAEYPDLLHDLEKELDGEKKS